MEYRLVVEGREVILVTILGEEETETNQFLYVGSIVQNNAETGKM